MVPGFLLPGEVKEVLTISEDPSVAWQRGLSMASTGESVLLGWPELVKDVTQRLVSLLDVRAEQVTDVRVERLLPGHFMFKQPATEGTLYSVAIYLYDGCATTPAASGGVAEAAEESQLCITDFSFGANQAIHRIEAMQGAAVIWKASGEQVLRSEPISMRSKHHLTCRIRTLP